MGKSLEKLIDEYLGANGRRDHAKSLESGYQELISLKRVFPSKCAKLTQDWQNYMLRVFESKLHEESSKLWKDYESARKTYLAEGTALLALEDWVEKVGENYQKDQELSVEIVACIREPWERMVKLRKEFLSNSNSSIGDVGRALNCFSNQALPTYYSESSLSTEALPIPPATADWDAAIKDAKSKTLMIHWGMFSRDEFKQLQRRTDATLKEYYWAVLKQRKLLTQRAEAKERAKKEEEPYFMVFSEQERASTSLKESYRSKILAQEGFFGKRKRSMSYYPYERGNKEFSRRWGLAPDRVNMLLGDYEKKMSSCIRSLEELTDYYPGVSESAVRYFGSGRTLASQSLSMNKLTRISCRTASVLPEDFDIRRAKLLYAFEKETGFTPPESIFTNLHDSEGRMSTFLSAMSAFERGKMNYMEEKIKQYSSYSETLKDVESTKKDILAQVHRMCAEDPAANGFWYDGKHTKDSAAKTCKVIATRASERFSLPYFTNPFKNRYSGYSFPEIEKWQGDGTGNLAFVYEGESNKKNAIRCLNNCLLSVLLAFPVKSLRITFVDPSTSNDCAFFTTRLATRVCRVVNRESEIRQLVEQWQAKASLVSRYTSDLVEYNIREKTFLTPYEVVVLLGGLSPSLEAQLEPFIENGNKYGVYFFSLNSNVRADSFRRVLWSGNLPSYDANCMTMTPQDDPVLMEALTAYINEKASTEEAVAAISRDLAAWEAQKYGDAVNSFSVPVGEVNGHPVFFKLSNQHIHSFVIGQTGQGKSVFLHNVISGAMLGYSPEQFQVILMDFKMAGEELYHYRGVKHVRALMASGSDLQLTYEVLSDLHSQMEERSALMREMKARTLEEYESLAHEKFPRILLVVDECQELFRDTRQLGENRIMSGIRDIIEEVARKGRSQGVHLLFATQTLSGTQLPPVIKNNITDYFLFKCVQEDSEQLVPGSGRKVTQLKVGHLLYSSCEGETTFQAYFPDVDRMVEAAKRKADAVKVKDTGFVFDGNNVVSIGKEELGYIKESIGRNLLYILGKSADVKRSNVGGPLKNDMGENILFVGYNSSQVARASFNALITLMYSNFVGKLGYTFYCLDLLQSEDPEVYLPLEAMARVGLKMIPQSRSGELIARLASDIREGVMGKTVLFILGQERFKAVRDEYELPSAGEPVQENPPQRTFGRVQPRTYRSELKYVLENGPEMGVHCLMQIDRVSKLLFESTVTSKTVYRMFNYVCLLRTEKEAEMRLGVDGLYAHQLSDQDSNLGAWFINDSIGKNEKFTPFERIKEDSIDAIFNK